MMLDGNIIVLHYSFYLFVKIKSIINQMPCLSEFIFTDVRMENDGSTKV